MHIESIHKTSDERYVAKHTMWPVHAMPNQKPITVGIEKPIGVPTFAFKSILDADLQRRGAQRIGKTWSPEAEIKLYRRLAKVGKPSRFECDNPILWVLRVRRAIWAATLAHAALRRPIAGDVVAEIPKGLAKASNSSRAMAAWACRYWRRFKGFDQVCSELYNEGSNRFDPLQEYETGHWLLWRSEVSGNNRASTFHNLRKAGLFDYWVAPVQRGPVDKEHIRPLFQGGWWPSHTSKSD